MSKDTRPATDGKLAQTTAAGRAGKHSTPTDKTVMVRIKQAQQDAAIAEWPSDEDEQ
jgi:hypothetical protein